MRPLLRRLDPILIQAVIAAALSFAHIHDIAEAAGQGGWKAWAYPISVDLLMVMAWRRIRTPDAKHGGAWVWFIVSLTASLGANIATAGVLDMAHLPVALRVLVAGWPALAFLGGSLLVHSEVKKPEEGDVETADEEVVLDPPMVEVEQVPAPPKPVLVTYAEAARALDVAPETVRGAANGANPRLTKYSTGPRDVRVDLTEARKVLGKRPAGV
ncbi:DUF2637 domain-containing protein [Streptomyces sp. NRRL F-5630]|uniref:DUF2637 domain-containing protein n=1 Tax=Streptomyces sp. NRRL F-5630 TaxID=1463864 RepID=UPI000997FDD3|nr:DUF2637 domain-containing protein [Streptomyces sp. NRRL F-5630]